MSTGGDDPKDERPDPFAPLPLPDSLLPKKVVPRASTGEPVAPPEPPPQVFAPPDAMPGEPTPDYEPSVAVSAEYAQPANYEPAPYVPASYDPPPSYAQVPSYEPAPLVEPPLVPETYSNHDLRNAVGATLQPEEPVKNKRKRAATPPPIDDDDDDRADKPRSRKGMLVAALTLLFGGGIVGVILLGRANSERYLIACEADRVVIERGRSFPPWGTSALDGADWRPLKIPPEAECHARETENVSELAGWYYKMIKDQATALLTEREVTKVDEAEADLKQGLLVARSLVTENQRIDARQEIERLLGDVAYWRASAKLRSAAEALGEAAKQFDAAAIQKPRHVTDAAAWATYVRKLVDDLHIGPAGVKPGAFPPLPPTERPTAPPGVALPIEPDADSGSAGSAAEPPPPPPPITPSGGVLL